MEYSFFRTQQLINSNTLNMCSDTCKQVFGATFGKECIQCLYPCDQLSRFQNVTKLIKKKNTK